MNSIRTLLMSMLLFPLTAQHVAEQSHAADDFVPLFSGRDFTGWRFGEASAAPKEIPAAWRIENGVIVGK